MKKIYFSLKNNFDWDSYEKKVYNNIVNSLEKVEVTWDLKEMTEIPSFTIIFKQVALMKKNKESIEKNIEKNIVIVSSVEKKIFLLWVFDYIYKPVNKTIIIKKD
tara:strand:+ start:1798 stop:2112 length:315 start_codon:yes stop_codon:yes gene_type:complete